MDNDIGLVPPAVIFRRMVQELLWFQRAPTAGVASAIAVDGTAATTKAWRIRPACSVAEPIVGVVYCTANFICTPQLLLKNNTGFLPWYTVPLHLFYPKLVNNLTVTPSVHLG